VCPGAGRGLYLRSPDRFRVRANTGPSLTRFALAAILCPAHQLPARTTMKTLSKLALLSVLALSAAACTVIDPSSSSHSSSSGGDSKSASR
jgi:hypothetical protein